MSDHNENLSSDSKYKQKLALGKQKHGRELRVKWREVLDNQSSCQLQVPLAPEPNEECHGRRYWCCYLPHLFFRAILWARTATWY